MSILGQKLQYMTEAYNDYSDPAYESYNADCGGSVLLEAESFDDMTDIIEACYKVDCKEISHLNNIMSLKESGASDSSIADAKSEYEYVHEADSKEAGEGIGAKLKKIWEKFKNFIFSIGRKIRSWFEDTKKTYDRYKDRIKGKSVTLQGYEYDFKNNGVKEILTNLNDTSIENLVTLVDDTEGEVFTNLSDRELVRARLRKCTKGNIKAKDIVLSGDNIGGLVTSTLDKNDTKKTIDEIVKRLNTIVDRLNKDLNNAQGDELARLQKATEATQKTISCVNGVASEYYKAIKEANSLYKKAILMMVSGKTGKKKEEAKKEESEPTENKEQTTQESYYFWD